MPSLKTWDTAFGGLGYDVRNKKSLTKIQIQSLVSHILRRRNEVTNGHVSIAVLSRKSAEPSGSSDSAPTEPDSHGVLGETGIGRVRMEV